MSSVVDNHLRMNGRLRVELEVIDDGEEIHANAFLDDEYAGVLHLVDGGLVDMIEVEPEFRRQGIATELLKTVLEAGHPVEHNWGNLIADGLAWLESIEPEKTRLCRIWREERRQAAERNDWLFPGFEEWLARRPQLDPVSALTSASRSERAVPDIALHR